MDSDGVGLSYRLPFNVQRFHHEANAITSFNSPENLTCFESGVCGPGDTGQFWNMICFHSFSRVE